MVETTDNTSVDTGAETQNEDVTSLIEGVNYNFLADNKTQFIEPNMQFIDQELTEKARSDPKLMLFKQWLLDNGAVFEDTVEFPCVFKGGLMGIAAKKDLKNNFAFLFVPNKCIISLKRIRAEPELAKIIEENDFLYGKKHPDVDQLTLCTFLMYHYLKGEDSFWWPYIQVMNTSDLCSHWPKEELDLIKDSELT